MPRDRDKFQRVDLHLPLGDEMTDELRREADQRGVKLGRHILDLLRARFSGRHGAAQQDPLWTPLSGGAVTPPPAPPDAAQPAQENPKAKEALGAWGRKK